MPLPSKYKSEKEKPVLSLTKGTLYLKLILFDIFVITICRKKDGDYK